MERRGVAGAACVVLVAAGVMATWATRPPAPRTETAADDVFSAARAYRHVEALAQRPRPVGSAAHAAARRHVVEELEALGLSPRLESGVATRETDGTVVAARVTNVVARLSGSARGPAVLLVAHYDSRPQTPGAGDDAAGVAAILETVRALAAGSPLERDVVVLLTDGEELGLLGARHFVADDPAMEDVGAVLNFEGRGNAGPVTMFESSEGSLPLVGELASASRPIANSMTDEVYRRMPNDTDLTVFREHGLPGLNFAFIGGWHAYHHALDTPGRLSRRTLQHHGDLALAMSRRLASGPGPDVRGGDAVWFNPLPHRLLVLPRPIVGWLVIATSTATAVLLLLAPGIRWRRLALAAASFLVALVAPALLMTGLWWLMARLLPALTAGPHGVPYAQGLFEIALWLLVAAVVLAVLRLTGSRCTDLELGLGWLAGLVALAVMAFVVVPGGVFVPLWPALGLTAGWTVMVLWRRRRGGDLGFRHLLLALVALPGVVLLVPLTHALFVALSMPGAAAVAIFATLTLALVPVLLRATFLRWGQMALVAGTGVVVLGVAVGVARDLGPERPRVDSLAYLLDSGSGAPRWLSFDPTTDRWTRETLGEGPVGSTLPEPFAGDVEVLVGTAPFVSLAPPAVRVTARVVAKEEREDGRRMELRVASRRGAPVMRLAVSGAAELVAVDGTPISAPNARRLVYFGVPPDGLRLSVESRSQEPLMVNAVDQSWGFGSLGAAAPAPRPPGIIPASGWMTDTVMVSTSAWIP